MKIHFSALTVILVFLGFPMFLSAQPDQCISDACGSLTGNPGICSGFENVICEGESFCISVETIQLEMVPLPNPDSIRIFWGDGTSQLEFSEGDYNHTYDFTDGELIPGGNCVNGDAEVVTITVTLYENCGPDQSCFFINTGISVKYLPRARFTIADTVCVGDIVCANDVSCFVDTYTFDFGDGTAPGSNNCHTYTTPGSYNVTLDVQNDCGTDSQTRPIVVIPETDALIGVPAELQDGSGCTGSYTFTNQSDETTHLNEYYIWQVFLNGSPQGLPDTTFTLEDFIHFFNTAGNYEVELSAYNDHCPVATDIATFELIDAPTVQLNLGFSVCESDQTTITIDGTNGYVSFAGDLTGVTYQWTLNGNPVSTAQFPGMVSLNSGSNTIGVTLTTACGNNTTSGNVTLDQEVMADAGTDFDICEGSSCVPLTGMPANGTWSGTGIQNDEFCPGNLAAMTYTLTYTVGNGACQNQDIVNATVIASPAVDAGPDFSFCETETNISLTGNPGNGSWTQSGLPFSIPFDADSLGAGNTVVLTYTVTDQTTGCTNTDEVEITIDGLSGINLTDVTVCDIPVDINLEDLLMITEQNESDVTWQGPGITNGQTGSFNSNQNGASGIGTYDIIATLSTNSCSASDTITVEVIQGEEALAGPDSTVCITNGTYSLSGSPASGEWAGPGITDPVNGVIDLNAAGGGTHSYTYTIFGGTSCEDADQVAIEIIDLGSQLTAGPDQDVCSLQPTFQLTGFSPPGGVWSGPALLDTLTGLIDVQQLSVDSCYNYTYTVMSQQVTACGFSDEMILCVQPEPIADFGIDGTACIGEDINFVNSSIGAGSYEWDFGDTGMSTDFEPIYMYADTGLYTITLVAISGFDCRDTSSIDVYITQPPTATGFLQSTYEACAPVFVDFTNTSAGDGLSYSWDFGTGETSAEFEPDSIFFPQGPFDTTYYITLTVSNLCATIDVMDSVLVHPQPVANFGTNFNSYCSGQTVDIQNASFGEPDAFEWDYGNGMTSDGPVPIDQTYFTGDIPDTIQIQLIATNECGIDTLVREIIIEPTNVEAFFNTSDTLVCIGDTICFTSFATIGASINYEFGDGNATNDPNPCHAYAEAGIYEVVQYANGCGFDSAKVRIEVLPGPDISFDHIPEVCPGTPVTFTNTSQGATGYAWDFGDGSGISVLTNPEYTYEDPGLYQVMLEGTDPDGCRAVATSVMLIYEPPVAQFNFLDSVCVDEPIGFISNSLGDIASCYWDFGQGDTIQACTATYVFPGAGNYNVSLFVTDTNGCVDSTSNEVFVRPPNFVHILADDITIFLGQSADLSTSFFATNPVFVWEPPVALSCVDCPDPIATPFRTTVYTVTMIDEYGCVTSDSIRVEVIVDRAVYVPNVFTPNGDGFNDLFTVFANQSVSQVRMFRVFDRWGEMVFERENFQPNVEDLGWNGQLNGKDMNPAVFVWFAEIEYVDGFMELITGDVTLLR